MNKFLKIFFLVAISVLVVNCNDDEEETTTKPEVVNDFLLQYKVDNDKIIDYLQTHSVTVDSEFNPTFVAVNNGSLSSIWISNLNNPSNPIQLLERKFISKLSGIEREYTIYYLKFNQGVGQRPTNLDDIYASYKGSLLDLNTTVFETNNNPEFFGILTKRDIRTALISGWAQILPQFSAALVTTNSNGGKTYSNYGAGAMFLPSGFAYFQGTIAGIEKTEYSPLIFSFKLNGVSQVDNDNDGVLSVNEDLNGDYYIDTINDDTDKDGRVDAFDPDDDGDNFLTSFEIKKPIDSPGSPNYLFNDIPDCSGNTTNPSRLKKHLDKNCK
jgi:hypothetical protein